ncbi:DUF308 domain-containing protein [Candidatus Saccharibacteria bacterium]|nr:DUF308 domain-containing protein [Candidatus Saccharibacteria bacterium]
MKELFNRTTISIIIVSVISFILGLIMTVYPGASLEGMGMAFGIYMIIYGVALIVLDFMSHNIYIPFYGIASGILSIIAGLVIVAMPGVMTTVFTLALGFWVILSSINMISMSISVRKGVKNWWAWLLLGIIDLICGIIIVFNPFASSISLVAMGGIFIMIHSVISIVDMVMIRKNVHELADAIKEQYKALHTGKK